MSFKIAIDSCGELLEEWKSDPRFESIPLTLMVGGETIVDDETFNQKEFLRKVAACPDCPRSACPSPERYQKAFTCDADHVYAVTLSAEMSGSYNSALVGRKLVLEEEPDKKIHVFNSCSASVGEMLIGKKIQELEEKGTSFEEVVRQVDQYIEEETTYFVLENLETLRKNGRLSKMKAMVATALKIRPVMRATPDGNIMQFDQARGTNRALEKMMDEIVAKTKNPDKKHLAISHCNCPARAQFLKESLQKRLSPLSVTIMDMRGISSMYANEGGVIVVI